MTSLWEWSIRGCILSETYHFRNYTAIKQNSLDNLVPIVVGSSL